MSDSTFVDDLESAMLECLRSLDRLKLKEAGSDDNIVENVGDIFAGTDPASDGDLVADRYPKLVEHFEMFRDASLDKARDLESGLQTTAMYLERESNPDRNTLSDIRAELDGNEAVFDGWSGPPGSAPDLFRTRFLNHMDDALPALVEVTESFRLVTAAHATIIDDAREQVLEISGLAKEKADAARDVLEEHRRARNLNLMSAFVEGELQAQLAGQAGVVAGVITELKGLAVYHLDTPSTGDHDEIYNWTVASLRGLADNVLENESLLVTTVQRMILPYLHGGENEEWTLAPNFEP